MSEVEESLKEFRRRVRKTLVKRYEECGELLSKCDCDGELDRYQFAEAEIAEAYRELFGKDVYKDGYYDGGVSEAEWKKTLECHRRTGAAAVLADALRGAWHNSRMDGVKTLLDGMSAPSDFIAKASDAASPVLFDEDCGDEVLVVLYDNRAILKITTDLKRPEARSMIAFVFNAETFDSGGAAACKTWGACAFPEKLTGRTGNPKEIAEEYARKQRELCGDE